jgi:hypothetical protein
MYQEVIVLFALDESTIMTIPSINPDKESPVNTRGEISKLNPVINDNKPNIVNPYAPKSNIGPQPKGFLARIIKYTPINPYTPHETLKMYNTNGSLGIGSMPNNRTILSRTDQGNTMNGTAVKHPMAATQSATFRLFISSRSYER